MLLVVGELLSERCPLAFGALEVRCLVWLAVIHLTGTSSLGAAPGQMSSGQESVLEAGSSAWARPSRLEESERFRSMTLSEELRLQLVSKILLFECFASS